MEAAHYSIYSETMDLIKICDEIVENNKNGNYIPGLPLVKDLESRGLNFYSNAKKFLITTYEIFEIVYKMPAFGSKFDKATEWISNLKGDKSDLVIMLKDDLPWVKLLSECRNAIEHPKKNYHIEVENFTIVSGNRFSPPRWRYDLTHNPTMTKQVDYSDLLHDFNVFRENMLTQYEQIMLVCIDEMKGFSPQFGIFMIPEDKMDNDCPVAYQISFRDQDKIKK